MCDVAVTRDWNWKKWAQVAPQHTCRSGRLATSPTHLHATPYTSREKKNIPSTELCYELGRYLRVNMRIIAILEISASQGSNTISRRILGKAGE